MFTASLFPFLKMAVAGLCLALVFASCATPTPAARAPVAAGVPGLAVPPEPGWVTGGPHDRFANFAYLTAVGSGDSRQAAEMDAFRALVSTFGVTVQADIRLAEVYRRTGAAATHDVVFGQEIILGAGMDNLIGAEIGDRWEGAGRGNTFALAVLNRERASLIYSDMIRANLEIIDNLTNMPPAERNSLAGFSRYQFAAVIADMNANYAAVLSVVGSPVHGLRSGDDFRRGAQEIAAAIPIGINVSNDRAGRIQGAFARAFSDLGFRTGGANQRYVLDVNLYVRPTDHAAPGEEPDEPPRVVFSRMELSADLIDTARGAVLLPFNFNQREGHRTQSEAENRVFSEAERRIGREYGPMLSDFLSQLIPGR